MKYLIVAVLMVVVAYAEGNTSEPLQLQEPKEVKQKPDFLYTKKGWALKIWYTAKGSRSEGTFGKLYHNGKEIIPKIKNEELQTPLGTLHYETSNVLWGSHGWVFTDADRVPPPSWQKK